MLLTEGIKIKSHPPSHHAVTETKPRREESTASLPWPYLVMTVLLRESPEFALQVNNASLLPDCLNTKFIVPLLQLPDLLSVLVLLNQAL